MSRRSSVGDQSRYSAFGTSQRSESYGKYSNPRPSSRNSQRNVLCDFCLVKKMRAVKSCLTCLTSFCETHLQAHYEYPALMKHKLVPASGQLKEKICAEHDKLLEVFCRSDQTCVCVLCIMDEHKKHDIVSAGAERTEKQKQLSAKMMSSQQKIDERVKKWQDLMQATESLKHSSQSVLEENERIFTELMQALERRYGDVKEMVRAQESALMTQAERHLSRMEEEITLLKKKHNDLERLSHSEDHINFLQSWQSLSAPSGYEDLSKVSLAPFYSFDKVKKAISEFKVQVEDVSKRELNNISSAAKEVQILQILDPKARDEFLQYYCQLSLDLLTAHPNLHLSKENTVVKMSSETNSNPEYPEKFDYWQQVMCREAMTDGRYYWEIEWSGTEVDIAVTHKEISRKGNDNACSFGWADKSWSLYCSESKYSFMHQNKRISIPVPNSSRIGVYLDHKAATLAFYSVSDTMTLLHKVNTPFTQPLYAGFGIWGYGSTVKIL